MSSLRQPDERELERRASPVESVEAPPSAGPALSRTRAVLAVAVVVGVAVVQVAWLIIVAVVVWRLL